MDFEFDGRSEGSARFALARGLTSWSPSAYHDWMISPPAGLSRRSALRLAAVGAGSLCFARNLAAAGRPFPEFSFLVITDTHLGHKNSTGAERQWAKTAKELAAAPGEFVLHLGDVVDGAREEQYPVYRKLRDTIGKPVHEIPGNHDPQPMFEQNLGVRADRFLDHRGVRFVLFNNSHRESHDGFITPEQLGWLRETCAGAARADRWLCFCTHVPVHANRPPDRAWHVKPAHGQKEFYQLLDEHAGRTLGVFHGHFHNGLRGWEDRAPVHEICFPSALYNQDRKLEASKAPGYNPVEFRPGYVKASLSANALKLEYQVTGQPDAVAKTIDFAAR